MFFQGLDGVNRAGGRIATGRANDRRDDILINSHRDKQEKDKDFFEYPVYFGRCAHSSKSHSFSPDCSASFINLAIAFFIPFSITW